MKARDVWIWVLCGVSLLFALHVWGSRTAYRAGLQMFRTQLLGIERVGRVPPAMEEMRRRVAADGGVKQEPLADWLAARTSEVSVLGETDTPLPGGWVRREAVLVAEDADYAAVERLLWGLASQEPRWVLESGEWTPGEQPGRGRALLAIAALLPPPLPPTAANGND